MYVRKESVKVRNAKIDAAGVSYDYVRKDENGEIKEVKHAVKDVSLQVAPGEFVAILGANGSGKSTFAKNLNALLVPTAGTLWVDGVEVAPDGENWELRRNVGMIFQNPDNQIVGSIVEEDVGFGPENLGVAPKGIWERVRSALRAVGMEAHAKSSPNALSGGQKQRVAIAGVLAMEPQCLILDESTAMLDPVGRQEVLQTVRRLNRENGVTVLLITHYMDEVVDADRVFVMKEGELRMSGTPREVFGEEALLAECGIELPQAARLALELRKEGMEIPEGILTVEELVDELCRLF